jgi:crotonobetainyl-CoA hydratase
MGGIRTGADAMEFLAAGASAISVGTYGSILDLQHAGDRAASLAVGAVLEILRATAALPLAQGYEVLRGGTLPTYQTMLRSEDAAEGPRAFGEKRPPQWRGR